MGTLIAWLIIAAFLYWLYRMVQRAAQRERQLQSIGHVIGRVGREAVLYAEPLRLSLAGPRGTRDTRPLTADTVLSVETAGGISATRGRNLGSKAVGGALTGGVGLFVFGNAKTKTVDNRELYLVIDSPPRAEVRKLAPHLGQPARQFALTVNQAARTLAA